MKTPSRRMLTVPDPKMGVGGYLFLTLLILGIGYPAFRYPFLLFMYCGLGILIWIVSLILSLMEDRRRRRLIFNRPSESICTFVHSFDCRHTDTWVLRAVYEELSRYLAIDGHPFPIRADDQLFDKDLKIDLEDFEELAADIALRAARSLDDSVKNPYYSRLRTVRDLVGFLEKQRKLNKGEAEGAANGSLPFCSG